MNGQTGRIDSNIPKSRLKQTLLVLLPFIFVLLFIMLIVISGSMRRDYEDTLQRLEQQENKAYSYSADVIKEQENSHTISITTEDTSNEVDDVSMANFKIK